MIWTLTVPPRPTEPVAPSHDPLPAIAPEPPPLMLPADDPGYAAAVSAHQAALAEREQSIAARDAAKAARVSVDAAYRDAHQAWTTEASAVSAIAGQPVKAVHGIVDIGNGFFRADVDIDIAGTVERCDYTYAPASVDPSPAHVQLVVLHPALVGQATAPPPLTKADLIAHAAARRWRKEVGGCVINGHQCHTDRESQSKFLGMFIAIQGGLRADPSAWKFADGFALISNADMAQVCLGVHAFVQGAYAVEAEVLAGIANGTITTKAQIDAVFA